MGLASKAAGAGYASTGSPQSYPPSQQPQQYQYPPPFGGLPLGHPPQQGYPQKQPGYRQPPQQPHGQNQYTPPPGTAPTGQYGAPPGVGYGGGGGAATKLQQTVQSKQLQAFYDPQRLQALAFKVEALDFDAIA
ncbi:hypothetical protein HK097_005012 [Rhizophlyctis rosea]|uniref:Uncharacterized protein n=1 Tax=Rhizophlyctis rosea TaxID=64517 RepID=A0AAD5WZ56_9FUNG|nr:hypothetical protein HK097_005012 [Rhizophlyctis rosea]